MRLAAELALLPFRAVQIGQHNHATTLAASVTL
jgi:hypothetical protein